MRFPTSAACLLLAMTYSEARRQEGTDFQGLSVSEAEELDKNQHQSADWHTRMTSSSASFFEGQAKVSVSQGETKAAAAGGKRSNKAKGTEQEAIVVIDVQHCFTNGLDASGEVVATGGLHSNRGSQEWKAKVVDFVKEKVAAGHPIVLLQDFHPEGHVSFLTESEGAWNPSGTFKERTMPKELIPGANADVMYSPPVFPTHCQQGTQDAQLIDDLCEAVGGSYTEHACVVPDGHFVVQKGTNVDVDSFGGIYDNRMGYNSFFAAEGAFPAVSAELAKTSSWGVLEWMHENGITQAQAIGIADDFCVKTTVLDLVDDAKANLLGVPALQHVTVIPEFTYGIFKHLSVHEQVGDLPHQAETEPDSGLKSEYTTDGSMYRRVSIAE